MQMSKGPEELFFLKGIFTFIVGGGLVALLNAIYKFYETRSFNKKNSAERAIQGIVKVYESLHEALSNSDGDRIVVVQLNNGGGIPRIGKNVYSSVVYEVCEKGKQQIKTSWQNQLIDEVYTIKISELMKTKVSKVIVSDLGDSDLRRIYTRIGAKASIAREVLIEKDRYVYMVMTCPEEDINFDKNAEILRDCASRLSRLFTNNF